MFLPFSSSVLRFITLFSHGSKVVFHAINTDTSIWYHTFRLLATFIKKFVCGHRLYTVLWEIETSVEFFASGSAQHNAALPDMGAFSS
jgi:hypothetical protein